MTQHRRYQQWLFLVIAMTVALLAVLPAARHVRVAEYDEAIYLDAARNIQRSGLPIRSLGTNGQLRLEHTPLYLYLLSLVTRPSVSQITFARWVTVLFGLACIALTFLVGVRLNDAIGGFVAALLLALNPFFALYSFFVRMEIPVVFMMLVAVVWLIESDGAKRHGKVGAAGVALAVAVLLKENALVFSLCCIAYVLWCRRRDGRAIWKSVTLIAAPVILALAGWALWSWRLSPVEFANVIRRWFSSAVGGSSLDPRTALSATGWAAQVAFDVLGLAWVVGLVVSFVVSVTGKGRRIDRERALLWGYLLLSVALSFGMRLKEPRHLMGILPIAAVLIGTSVDWKQVALTLGAGRSWRMVILGVIAVLFVIWASPLQVPIDGLKSSAAWLKTPYRWRVFENDRFYNVLRLAGIYLRDHSAPSETITVAHQATVVGYYADRHYFLLYTLPLDGILQILERTRFLVWDDPAFLVLNDQQIEIVRDYVAQHFAVDQVVRDDYRQVTVYRRHGD